MDNERNNDMRAQADLDDARIEARKQAIFDKAGKGKAPKSRAATPDLPMRRKDESAIKETPKKPGTKKGPVRRRKATPATEGSEPTAEHDL